MLETVAEKFDMCRRRGDLLISLSILISSVYLIYITFQIPRPEHAPVGPRVFPLIMLSMMLVLSLWLSVKNIKTGSISELVHTEHPRNFWIGLAFIILYAYLLDIVGFVVLTPIATFAFMYAIGIRNWKILIGGTLALWLVLTFAFPVFMEVQLPRGIGVFRQISYLIY